MSEESLIKQIKISVDLYEQTKDKEHLFDIVRAFNVYGFPMKGSELNETVVSDEYFWRKFGRFDRWQGKHYRND